MPSPTARLCALLAAASLALSPRGARADEPCIPEPVASALAATLQAPLRAEADFAQARAALEAGELPKAAVLLRRVAVQGADAAVGVHAMQLYLDALNRLGTAGAPACFDDLGRDVPSFIDLYCQEASRHVEARDVLVRVRMDLQRLRAETLVRDAERGAPDPDAAYQAAGDLNLELWTHHGEAACLAKQARCERMDEILYDAARAYQAARRPEEALSVRKRLLEPRYHLDGGELAQRTRYELGAHFQAIGAYDEAASWYEDFAGRSPKAAKALEALEDAVMLRLALGQMQRAITDADLFSKQYGAKSPARTARVAFAVAMTHLEREDLRGARRHLEGSMRQIDAHAAIDLQIRAHAALGRTLELLGDTPAAAAEHEKVRALYRDPFAVVQRLRDLDESTQLRALGALLTAVGESLFFAAEQKRRAAEQLRRPAYAGASDDAGITAYFGHTLPEWLKARRQALDEAEQAYGQILRLQPASPPRWTVAAAARVAAMYAELSDEVRGAPAPKTGKSDEALQRRWRRAAETFGEPLLQRAKGANRSCVDLSAKYAYQDSTSQACADWLSRHFPDEYPRMDELLPGPWRDHAALVPLPRPVAAR